MSKKDTILQTLYVSETSCQKCPASEICCFQPEGYTGEECRLFLKGIRKLIQEAQE